MEPGHDVFLLRRVELYSSWSSSMRAEESDGKPMKQRLTLLRSGRTLINLRAVLNSACCECSREYAAGGCHSV